MRTMRTMHVPVPVESMSMHVAGEPEGDAQAEAGTAGGRGNLPVNVRV